MLNDILENRFIENLASTFARSPLQENGLQESDAELIRLTGSDIMLAIKVDSIVEEIEMGLYRDPYLIGWMTVTAPASDLAAVGAKPLGILIAETLAEDSERHFISELQRGIKEAGEAYGMHVLGGDTNFSGSMQMTGCALGIITDSKPMMRRGCKPGDHIYSSERLGLGSAYALSAYSEMGNDKPLDYRPLARLKEGELLRRFASACMDTSDGLLATLDQLMRLNGTGFDVSTPLDQILHKAALDLACSSGIPPWLTLCGPHGEFELVFTIPPQRVDEFLQAARNIDWAPIYLGRVTETCNIMLNTGGGAKRVPTGAIRDLFSKVSGDLKRYISALLETDAAGR
jgi:thiamine-monophosphate kinase